MYDHFGRQLIYFSHWENPRWPPFWIFSFITHYEHHKIQDIYKSIIKTQLCLFIINFIKLTAGIEHIYHNIWTLYWMIWTTMPDIQWAFTAQMFTISDVELSNEVSLYANEDYSNKEKDCFITIEQSSADYNWLVLSCYANITVVNIKEQLMHNT